jgi:hypothetical protein
MRYQVKSDKLINKQNIKKTSLTGGTSENGETLYIGRVHYQTTVTIGKVHNRICYVPFGGKERESSSFQILMMEENPDIQSNVACSIQ